MPQDQTESQTDTDTQSYEQTKTEPDSWRDNHIMMKQKIK